VIAVIGQSVLDRTRWPDGTIEQRLGGAPVFAARALADVCPAVVLTHGGDVSLRRPLLDTGLEVVAGPSRRTTVFDVSLFGDGTWAESISVLGDPFTEEDVRGWMAPALEPCSAVVCGTQWRGDFPPETLAALARGGRRVYLDGQGPTRPRRLGPVRVEGPLDPATLVGVEVLKLGQPEAEAVIGGVDPLAAAALGVPVVVVTLGERGAVVMTGGKAVAVPVEPVLGLADTVGAGDAFLALVAAALEGGADPVTAVRRACDGAAAHLRARLLTERPPITAVASGK